MGKVITKKSVVIWRLALMLTAACSAQSSVKSNGGRAQHLESTSSATATLTAVVTSDITDTSSTSGTATAVSSTTVVSTSRATNSAVSTGTSTSTATASSTATATASQQVTLPSAQFLAPAMADESPTNGTYTLSLRFSNAPTNATYDIYQTTTVGAKTGGTAVVTGNSLAVTSVAVSTSGLANASYGYYVVLHAAGSTYTFAAPGSVRVFTNGAPSVQLTGSYKSGAMAIVLPATITFSASDPDGDPLTIKLEYSADSGATWTVLTSNLAYTNGVNYVWDTAGHMPVEGEALTYRLRITATDNHGGAAIDTTSANFGVAAAVYGYAANIKGLLNGSCSGCHGNGGGNSNVYIYSDYTNGNGTGTYDKRTTVVSRMANGSMPPGGGVSASTNAKMQLWLWQGAGP